MKTVLKIFFSLVILIIITLFFFRDKLFISLLEKSCPACMIWPHVQIISPDSTEEYDVIKEISVMAELQNPQELSVCIDAGEAIELGSSILKLCKDKDTTILAILKDNRQYQFSIQADPWCESTYGDGFSCRQREINETSIRIFDDNDQLIKQENSSLVLGMDEISIVKDRAAFNINMTIKDDKNRQLNKTIEILWVNEEEFQKLKEKKREPENF